jgi:hypothetical protein
MRFVSCVEVGALAAIAASYFIVWPIGKYAVLDEWTYLQELKHLHDQGRLEILDINPMSVVGLLVWAWPFAEVFGFSCTVARLSVVMLHAAECLSLARLLSLCEVPGAVRMAAVATLIFSPLHFFHSFTFMTDVPAVAWQTIAAFCYARAIAARPTNICSDALHSQLTSRKRRGVFGVGGNSSWWLIGGSLAAAMAFLIRQSGVVVPLAFAAYALAWDRRFVRWQSLWASLMAFAAVAAAFTHWYFRIHGPTSAFQSFAQRCLEFLSHPRPRQWLFLNFAIAAYVGFFLWPLPLALSRRVYRLGGKRQLAFALFAWGAMNVFLYFYVHDGRVFPYLINVITRFGLFTTNDVIVGERDVVWGKGVQWAMNAAVLGSLFSLVLVACGHDWKAERGHVAGRVLRFLLILLAFQVLYCFATAPILYDRHLLILAPTSIAVLCLLVGKAAATARVWFWVGLAPSVFYSIAGTHDIHAMSRAAFIAGDELISKGVDPRFIDGGYAFDGWYMYDRPGQSAQPRAGSDPWWLRQLVPGIDEEYVVSSSTSYDPRRYLGKADVPPGPSLNDREVVKTYSYRGFWPWKTQHVYLLKRRAKR